MSEFKSSRQESEKEGNLLDASGSALQEQFGVSFARTNLPVVGNLQDIMEHLSTTNANYKTLLSSNANSVKKLGLEFEGLDKEMTENMMILHE